MATGILDRLLGPKNTPEQQEQIRQILAQSGVWSGPQVTPTQAAYFASQFAPGAGALDAMGGMPVAPTSQQSLLDYSTRNPSMAENFRQGNYGTAVLQGMGLLGDAMYTVPLLGATAGTLLKAPRATQKAYKLFRQQKGDETLYPLFVNSDKGVATGEWIPAESGQAANSGKVKSSIGELAYRPGWHAGDIPAATHIGGKSEPGLKKPDYRKASEVWAEVEFPADVDWQTIANERASRSKAGKIIPRTAQITDQIPEGGFYRYKTNPNMLGEWLIGGSMKVNKPITQEEALRIGEAAGVMDLPLLPQVIADKNLKYGDLSASAKKELRDYYPDFLAQLKGESNPSGQGRVISERFPTAVKATENPLQEFLRADVESMMRDPAQAKKIADTVKQYVNYRGTSNNPETVIQSMKEHSIDNLNFIFDQMPEEIRNRAAMWYDGANRKTNQLAQQYRISNEAVAGVIAAMSPQKDWYQNVSLGERVIDIVKTKSNTPFDDSIYKTGLDKLKNKDQLQALERLRGKTLGEVTDPIERAIWVRMFDETYNPREYNIYSPEGDKLGIYKTAKGEPRKVAWGSFNEITKALMVIDDPSIENISRQMGKQHKVRNFYNNIIMPSNPSSITADTHAVAAALMRPLGGSATEVGHNLGSAASSSMTGIQGTYPIFADAYRDVAAQRGLLPRQSQSIAWEGVRGLFSPEQKRDRGLLDKVNNIMLEYRKGKMTQREMQNAILNEAGGITKPDWAR